MNSTREYLCTVKCGPATSDENLRGSSQNSSAHSSEEESWVDVKAPGSSLKETQVPFFPLRNLAVNIVIGFNSDSKK